MRLLPLPKCVSRILSPGLAYRLKIHVYSATGFCVGWIVPPLFGGQIYLQQIHVSVYQTCCKLIHNRSLSNLADLYTKQSILCGFALIRSQNSFRPKLFGFFDTRSNSRKYVLGGICLSHSFCLWFFRYIFPFLLTDKCCPSMLIPYGGSTTAKSNALSGSARIYSMQSML